MTEENTIRMVVTALEGDALVHETRRHNQTVVGDVTVTFTECEAKVPRLIESHRLLMSLKEARDLRIGDRVIVPTKEVTELRMLVTQYKKVEDGD